MKKKLLILLIGVISVIVIGTSIGLGVYFWLNPLSGADEDLKSGTVLLEGTFVEFDSSHYGRGTVQIVEFSNGSRQVQFVDVEIVNGPDLFVYLSDKSSFSGTHDQAGNYINLGALPYNVGNFSVNIHEATSINNVNSVLIWCRQFSVAFTYASLS